MNSQQLIDVSKRLLVTGKGILAMDESVPTCNKRFAKLGISQTVETRRAYRELLVSTADLNEFISGAILCDETIRQQKRDGTPFAASLTQQGIVPGIKVDAGIRNLAGHPNESITEGLDGLRERLAEYRELGACFAKWRAALTLDDRLPTRTAIAVNAHALARYAVLSQEAGLVPIVEPEVLMEGEHTVARCGEVTETVLRHVFAELCDQGVLLEGMLLKPNMVLPGLKCREPVSIADEADLTVKCMLRSVPAAVPGITFLSGGQSCELATLRLNEMNLRFQSRAPWELSFSFARALQQPAMETWMGSEANVTAAQRALYHRAKCNGAARRGVYSLEMEDEAPSSVEDENASSQCVVHV